MQLVFFVINDLKADFWCDVHVHACWEIVYNVSAPGTVVIGDREIEYKPRQILVHRPGSPHNCYNKDSTVHYCLGALGDEIEGLEEGVFDGGGGIAEIVGQLAAETSTRGAYYKELIELKAREVILLLRRLQLGDTGLDGRGIPMRIRDMKGILDREYQKKIDLTFLSNEVLLSVDYIRHEFKKHYGVSPLQYLIKKRVDYAKHLLITSPMSIKQVAYQCGFENEYYFSRLFKKLTGISPRQYRLSDEAPRTRWD